MKICLNQDHDNQIILHMTSQSVRTETLTESLCRLNCTGASYKGVKLFRKMNELTPFFPLFTNSVINLVSQQLTYR